MGETKKAYLIVLEGADSGLIHTLASLNTLGSEKNNTIMLHDRRITSHHASIYKKYDEYWLYNSERTNQLHINGKPAQKVRLCHGDIISLAATSLLFLEGQDSFKAFPAISSKSRRMPAVTTQILDCVMPQNYTKILEKQLASKAGTHLRTMVEVSIAISKIYELEILLKRILSIVARGFPADRGFIMVIKPDKKCEVKAFFDKGDNGDFSHSKNITRRVLSRRTSLLYNPIASQSSPYENLSCLSVPLSCKGKLLGIAQLEVFSGYTYTHNDLDHLREIAVQTAIAIDNLETHQQPVRYRQHLIALERFSQTLSQSLDKQKIIKRGARAAKTLFRSTRISILLSTGTGRLQIAYAIGIPKREWKQTIAPIKGTLAGKVFQGDKALLIANAHKLPKFLRANVGETGYRSLSCILAPIQVSHYNSKEPQNIGVICVTDKKDGASFTVLERNLLALLANQIGTAVTNAQLYEKATVDPLTKVNTRGYFFQKLQKMLHKGMQNLSVLMLDLDNFKSVNDNYTHQAGDRVLEQIGLLLRQAIEENELVGRYGGEEFLLGLHCGHSLALARAVQLGESIASHSFDLGELTLSITSSIGVSTIRPTDTLHLLVERSDKALYLAKGKGRNCVVSETEIDDECTSWSDSNDR